MGFFKGDITKTLKNASKAWEIKTREWCIETKDQALLDLAEHRKDLAERKQELGVDENAWKALQKELEDFK